MSKRFSFSGSSSGWITTEIFDDWVNVVFIPEITKRREKLKDKNLPALLIVDVHESRRNIKTLEKLKEEKIDVLCLPEHSTHLLQPLDIGYFSNFKRSLESLKYRLRGQKTQLRRERLLEITFQALYTANFEDHLATIWRKSGIYPFNRKSVLENELVMQIEDLEKELPKPKKGGRVKISLRCLTDNRLISEIAQEEKETERKKQEKGTNKRGRPKKNEKQQTV